ncbi:hypothetical protein CO180_04640 [candidate division WWE3 bacterium CG_4_9_14_3_um_filter_41_6]|uniref:Methyltransferase type 11 domain-containing protein n=1 Tax=candidate division WWE3 bacterium CG_4_10_14_0_2_um_filter_41_14 TaxID=1975072 RepID=A0A2M7TEM4_UNCKA|nr:MAG: hypothetical protein COY32_07050 [candidate division WWE3 bacterium CG_4_10_14_0_2_um_filter_41_14]PJA37916.1 MAG: hypothetical protein CO180_04640 [candidate division WWE3 bacterium CG_4_9_14_3_um_filter_41_6]
MDIADYDKSHYDYQTYWQNRAYENLVEHKTLSTLLPSKGTRILDLGGSFGRLMDVYAPRFEQAVIYDYSERALQQAKESAEKQGFTNIETVQGEATHLPFDNDSFDAVIVIRVLHHLTEPNLVFSEIHRILKPNGVCIIDVPNKIHLKNRIKHLFAKDFDFASDQTPENVGTSTINGEQGIFINYHPQSIMDLLTSNGFAIQKRRSILNARSTTLKGIFAPQFLSACDEILQPMFTIDSLGPQIWIKAVKTL